HVTAGILTTDISDHYATFLILHPEHPSASTASVTTSFCCFNERNLADFRNAVSLEEWPDIYASNDPEEIFDRFYSTLWSYYDRSFPVKSRKRRDVHQQRRFLAFKSSGSVADRMVHKSAKNLYEVKHQMKQRTYFSNLFPGSCHTS